MKKIFSYLSSFTVLSLVCSVLFWYFFHNKPVYGELASPLPDFLNLSKNEQVNHLNVWLPLVPETQGSRTDMTQLTAKSVLMYDLASGKAIYEKNAKAKLPIASLTKIMTALVAIDNKKDNNAYLVGEEHLVGENNMGLSAGEKLTLEDLLYGLLLSSGNDAAEVIAGNYPKGRLPFIQAMNDKAAALGLTGTHFTNPSGLQGDGDQYSTAYDLLVITKYALENYPLFAQIVATPVHTIAETRWHKSYTLANETNLLTTYEGVKGVKTGFTPEAGLCLITYLDYGGHKIIGIILHSKDRRMEMKELLDYSLKKLGTEPPVYKPLN